MRIRVETISYDGGTLAIGTGTDVETGEFITFGGDWRPMRDIAEAIQAGEEQPVTEVEGWAILSRTAP